MRLEARAALIGLAVAAVTPEAIAAAADPPQQALRVDLDVDLPLTIMGGSFWILTELDKPGLRPPDGGRWVDGSLNEVDAWFRSRLLWKHTKAPALASDVMLFGVAPAGAVGLGALAAAHDGRSAEIGANSLVVAEALTLSTALNQVVKYAAGRRRPYARFQNQDVLDASPDPNDQNLSFYSGHTTATFALAVASGTVASLRGYRLAPLVWAHGVAVAATTGYLRIAADRHYFTDVLTGMLTGAAMGVLVPLLHRAPSAGAAVSQGATPLTNGATIGLSGVW